jgi:flagellar hook-associated protein 3 FlgL
MRITFNTTFKDGLADVNAAAQRLAEWQRQVSSQKRVQAPSDDPSAAAAGIREQAEMAALDQYRETSDSVQSRLTVADAALSDIISSLTAAQTTTAAARTTVLTPEQRQALAQQLRGIRDTILQAFNTQYRGTFVFSGTAALTAPFVKDGAGVVQPYAGTTDVQVVDIDRNRTAEVTLDGGAVAGTLFADLDALATAIETGSMAQIDAGAASLEAAFRRATTAQSGVGITLGDLDALRGRLGTAWRAAEARRSSLEDANLAEAISRWQQAQTAYEASLGALGTRSRLSLMDYLR